MGSLFTSIGKILNIKFLLILLTILLFADIYFTFYLKDILWENYQKYIDLQHIVSIVVLYLITINVAVPMIALLLSFLMFFISLGLHLSGIKFLQKTADFLKDDELQTLEIIQEKAIKENNSALMKSYELRMEDYKELHVIYLFSFFLTLEILFQLINYDDFSNTFIYQIYNYLDISDSKKDEFIDIFLLYIPIGMLSLFSIRYVTSFTVLKIDKWVKFFK